MATLTVLTLVLVITTVAQAAPLSRQHDVPWSRWNASPNLSVGVPATRYGDFELFEQTPPAQGYAAVNTVGWQMPGQ